ncbi:MAG: hypothetical protein AMS24_03740 [Chlamydiae bacterium SM23_39]|nr:MAG: hypothetical protein AMS24_03740 [Chlamydiae bacterium SM23_39]
MCFLFLFLSCFIFSSEKELIERIEGHIFLEDYNSAILEAKKAIEIFDDSKDIKKIYIRSLALAGFEKEAILFLKKNFSNQYEKDILEDIAWSILRKGFLSSQNSVRLSSLIGAFFADDIRSVEMLKNSINDRNAILRAISVKLSSYYGDDVLKNKISSLLEKEKTWFVRLEILKSVGEMKIKEREKYLKEFLKGDITFEERILAIKSLIEMHDSVDPIEIKKLLNSKYSNFRILGCEIASHFKIEDVKDEILLLTSDPISDVRLSALNSIALFYFDKIDREKIQDILKKRYNDTNPYVAITASWVALIVDPIQGKKNLKNWIFDKYLENRIFASSAIAQSGSYGLELAKELVKKTEDSYVKVNLALGILGQREEVKYCLDVLFSFLKNKSEMWMWSSEKNPLFRAILPSTITYIDQFPNYPEAIDQSVQLELISLLSILKDERAKDAIKRFLKEKRWGISGFAAAVLIKEGDDESLKLVKELLNDKEVDVRVQAALALAFIGKEEDVYSILEEAYYRADYYLKLVILEAIGKIKNKNSISFLLKTLEEPFFIIKTAAASSLLQIIKN